MKPISQITIPQQQSEQQQASSDGQMHRAIDSLFTQVFPIFMVYCDGFKNEYGRLRQEELRKTLYPIAREYAAQLLRNGIGQKGVQRGIDAIRTSTENLYHAPNPRKFVDMCKPTHEELGIPSEENAIREIIAARGTRGEKFEYSHFIIQRLDRAVGRQMYELDNARWQKLVKDTYATLTGQYLRGELKAPVALLENNQPDSHTEVMQKAIQEAGEEIIKTKSADPLIARITNLRQRATS